MRMRHLLPFFLLPGLLTAALANPYETTLKNGLRVIVKEDRRAPTAAQMVWYRIGSMDEVDGASGVAHVLEHMMFKGTPSVGPGEFNKLVAAAGGRDNAFTSRDYTAYFQQVPNEKLAEMMRLEADRMRHLNVDAKEFAQEIKVVMEERRMRTDDNPQSRLFEPLSERELDVLRLLASDLVGPDIARELHVSLNTLRTHTQRIFTQLDVNNRSAAVRRAPELGLPHRPRAARSSARRDHQG